MTVATTASVSQTPRRTGRSNAARAILGGGLTVGVLDTLLAMSLFQASPYLIYQSIASGLLGLAAYDGGMPTAFLGMFLHFFIATTATATYWFVSQKIPTIGRHLVAHWFPFGLTYGVFVYYFMKMVVLLSRFPAGSSPRVLWRMIGSIVGHAFLVGLPIAWITQHYSNRETHEKGVERASH
jgi:hypothetical protein